jgi:hypothetical protein
LPPLVFGMIRLDYSDGETQILSSLVEPANLIGKISAIRDNQLHPMAPRGPTKCGDEERIIDVGGIRGTYNGALTNSIRGHQGTYGHGSATTAFQRNSDNGKDLQRIPFAQLIEGINLMIFSRTFSLQPALDSTGQ